MNPYYTILDDFDNADLEVVKHMFYTKLYPIHKANSTTTANKTDFITVTNFRFDDMALSSDEQSLFLKYPILGTDCLINESSLFGGTPIHIDGTPSIMNRMCAINFPIIGGNDLSPTIFFGQLTDYEYYYDEVHRTSYPKNPKSLLEKDRVYLIDKPVLINVRSWHKVRNFGLTTRIAFSWSCKYGIDYAIAYGTLQKGRNYGTV